MPFICNHSSVLKPVNYDKIESELIQKLISISQFIPNFTTTTKNSDFEGFQIFIINC